MEYLVAQLEEALKGVGDGDFDPVVEALGNWYSESDLRRTGVCEAIASHPVEGLRAACVLLSSGYITSDEEMVGLLFPIVCEDALEKNEESRTAVRKFIDRPSTGEGCLRKAADWMRGSGHVGNRFVDNALVDVLWRLGGPEDLAEMTKVAEASAAGGSPEAMGRLCRMYMNGKGYRKNLDKAEEWARKASEAGLSWAKADLKVIGKLKAERNEGEASVSKTRDKAAKSAIALYNAVSKSPDEGRDIEGLMRVIEYYAEAGSPSAMIRIAKAYGDGAGVEKDDAKAEEWTRKAVESVTEDFDDAEGRLMLAKICAGNPGARETAIGLVSGLDEEKHGEDLHEVAVRLSYEDGDLASVLKSMGLYKSGSLLTEALSASSKGYLLTALFETYLGMPSTYGAVLAKSADPKGLLVEDCQVLINAKVAFDEDFLVNPKVVSKTLNRMLDVARKSNHINDDDYVGIFSSLKVQDGGFYAVHEGVKEMMSAFDRLCKSNGVKYMISCGTLLGAYRHKGFVPWDDDADFYILRDDFEKLKAVLPDDSPFRLVSKVYMEDPDKVSYYNHLHLKSSTSPLFLDLMILDYVESADDEGARKYARYVSNFRAAMDRLTEEDLKKGEDPTKDERVLEAFESRKASFRDDMNGDRKTAVAITLDNPGIGRKRKIFNYSDLFPTVDLEFEDIVLPAPRNCMKVLVNLYIEPMKFPGDLLARSHVQHEGYDLEEIRRCLEKW